VNMNFFYFLVKRNILEKVFLKCSRRPIELDFTEICYKNSGNVCTWSLEKIWHEQLLSYSQVSNITSVLCVNQTNQSYQLNSKTLKATQGLEVFTGIKA
jgi:hypothetical protein